MFLRMYAENISNGYQSQEKKMRKSMGMNKIIAAVLLNLLVSGGFCQAAAPAIFNEMPADAILVIATKPISELGPKMTSFAQQMGLISPDMPVSVDQLLAMQMGIPGLLDASQGVALAFTDLDNMEESMAVYIPVTDSKAALGMMSAVEDAAAGTWSVPDKGMFLKPFPKHLLLCNSAPALAKVSGLAKGIKLAEPDQQLFDKADAALFFKLEKVLPAFREKMKTGLTQDAQLNQNPGMASLMNIAVDRLCELQNLSAALRLANNGINLQIETQAQPGTVMANYLSNHPKTGVASLANLPTGNFLTAAAFKWDPKVAANLINTAVDAMSGDPQLAGKLKADDLNDLKKQLTQLFSQLDSGSVAMYPPANPNPAGGMQMISIGDYPNIKQILKNAQSLSAAFTKVSGQMGTKVPLTFTPNAGKVENLSYDEAIMDLSQMNVPAESAQAMTMLTGGKNTMSKQICIINEHQTAACTGEGALQQAITLAKNNPTGLDKDANIAQAAANLPSQANVYAFINIGPYMQSMMGMMSNMQGQPGMNPMVMMMTGMFSQIQGTVGMSAILENGRARGEIFVPGDLIKSLAAVGMQAAMGPQAGMQPGMEPAMEPEENQSEDMDESEMDESEDSTF